MFLVFSFLLLSMIFVYGTPSPLGHTVHYKLVPNGTNPSYTALLLASKDGYTEIVRVLIAAGADLNAKSNSGWTALMEASRDDDIEIAKALIQAGADIYLRSNNGRRGGITPLMIASKRGNTEIVNMLKDAGARW